MEVELQWLLHKPDKVSCQVSMLSNQDFETLKLTSQSPLDSSLSLRITEGVADCIVADAKLGLDVLVLPALEV